MDETCDEDVIPSSLEMQDVIKPIGKDTIHRICSGQVVLSLAIAMKELVENAIDASANNIEIKLVEYGSELVEVSDNGTGIKKENFQGLTQKHATSKIRNFDDLEFVQTLGFRGEALSSLCALCDLTVVTRHSSVEHATKISYDQNGAIIDENPTARPVGTTISLKSLFKTLPVRRKEFTKNLKREFNKMCQLLNAYCLVSKGIKFTCTNVTSKGHKNKVVSTQGLDLIRSNIISIFGTNQIPSLVEVELVEPDDELLEEFNLKRAYGEKLPFKMECHISNATHGSGRSSSDRQFFYINSRPFESTKITKLVNETYRRFNGNQYPFVFMNLVLETNQIDVNVTPDKRQIFMQEEKLLLCAIKASLLNSFKNCPSTYSIQNLEVSKLLDSTSPRGVKRSLSEFAKSPVITQNTNKKIRNESSEENNKTLEHFNFTSVKKEDVVQEEEVVACFLKQRESCRFDKDNEIIDIAEISSSKNATNNFRHESETDISLVLNNSDDKDYESDEKSDDTMRKSIFKKFEYDQASTSKNTRNFTKIDDFTSKLSKQSEHTKSKKSPVKTLKKPFDSDEEDIAENSIQNDKSSILFDETNYSIAQDTGPKEKKIIPFKVSMDAVKKSVEKRKSDLQKLQQVENNIKFRSEITPEANKSAEQELQKQISKEMFKKMDIVGQFNMGFIIAKLENDLFIVDQHATDEKYNFEQLQLTTIMENQKLVVPKPLNLTVANEELLVDNEEVFKKNGFTFKIDHSAESTKKILLTSIPISKSYIFGKDDIDEMLFMLQDASNTMVRPSRIRGMFASRACRKSVMIGKPLCKSEMRRLLDHMSEIDQPWNCPHGRPTMRHLISLNMVDL